MSIELKNVTYTYSQGTSYEIHALKNISLDIPDGQFIGVIGHTGSGKSTLIQHLNALIQPTSGTVSYNGEDVWAENYNRRALRSEVGLVFQYPEHQLFESDVLSDVCFGPKNLGLDKKEVELRAYQALKQVGLEDEYFYQSPFDLSGGQKRRVAIAGVLAMKPDVLILDEPTAGLDPRGREAILAQLRSYHKQKGNTVILVSHSMEEIARNVDRIEVKSHSHKLMDGTPEEVFSRADELLQVGLDVPQVTKVAMELQKRGLLAESCVYTIDELVRRLLALKGGEAAC